MVVESRARGAVKTMGWRLIAASMMGAFAYVATRSGVAAASLATAIFVFDLVAKTIGLYAWERLWSQILWGRSMNEYPGACVWLTGLPAAGKTTIAKALVERLEARLIPCDRLDGDVVRRSFCSDLGFSKADRDENILRNSYVASYLSHSGRIAVASFVSPYVEARRKARGMVKNMVEVFVSCPLDECERRDAEDPNRAGLYAKARAGLITGFTGIDDPYEQPLDCELVLETAEQSVDECVDAIISVLEARGLLTPLTNAQPVG